MDLNQYVNEYLIRKMTQEQAKSSEGSVENSGQKLDAVAQDAARYRFLRRLDHFATVDAMLDTMDYHTLDAAVDAAMLAAIKSQPTGKHGK